VREGKYGQLLKVLFIAKVGKFFWKVHHGVEGSSSQSLVTELHAGTVRTALMLHLSSRSPPPPSPCHSHKTPRIAHTAC